MASYGDDFKCKNFVCDQAHIRNTKSQNVTGITGAADPNLSGAEAASRPGKVGDLYFHDNADGLSAIYVCTDVSGTAPDIVYTWTKYGEEPTTSSGGA